VNSKWAVAPAVALGLGVVSSGQWAVAVGIAAFCFVVGYVLAIQSQRVTSNYPWHMPPVFWGVLGALLPIIGFVVESVACFTTTGQHRSLRARQNDWQQPMVGQDSPQQDAPRGPNDVPPPQTGPWTPPAGPAPSSPEGNWPQPPWPPAPGAPGTPATPAYESGPWPAPLGPEAFQQPTASTQAAGWQPPYAASAPPEKPTPLFGWYPDPTGRHEQRYWDGRQWSSRVADNGVKADDPEGAV
jgi:hypothetical protein